MKRVGVLVFSPTGTTAQVCSAVAEAIPQAQPEMLNVTLPMERSRVLAAPEKLGDGYDRLVVGVPVYSGKVPAFAQSILANVRGNGVRATAVVVFGNIEYGIALRTLTDLLVGNGFLVDSIGAFVGEHTYSGFMPVAKGRPDGADLEKAREFGRHIQDDLPPVWHGQIPAQVDMFTRSKRENGVVPYHDEKLCRQCGTCALQCPRGIIEVHTGAYASRKAASWCLGCASCVSACPHGARRLEPNFIQGLMGKMVMRRGVGTRTEPIYLTGQPTGELAGNI